MATQFPGPNPQDDNPTMHPNGLPAPGHPIPEPEPLIPEAIVHIPAEPDIVDELVEEPQQPAPPVPNTLLHSLVGLEQVDQDEGGD